MLHGKTQYRIYEGMSESILYDRMEWSVKPEKSNLVIAGWET